MAWDWVPAATTAVVAIGGYIATWAATKQQASTELDKLQVSHRYEMDVARRQERREVYSRFLKSSSTIVNTIGQVAAKLPDLNEGVGTEVNRAIAEMQSVSYEAMLIADNSVSLLIDKSVTEILMVWKDVIAASTQGEHVPSTLSKTAGVIHKELMKAMVNELQAS